MLADKLILVVAICGAIFVAGIETAESAISAQCVQQIAVAKNGM